MSFNTKDFKDIYLDMVAFGYDLIIIEFDGSGDSGTIDNAYARNLAGGYTYALPTDFETKIREVCDSILDHTNVDWYNNDGGYGSIKMSVNNEKETVVVEVNVYTRYTESNLEFAADDLLEDLKEQGLLDADGSEEAFLDEED